MLSAVEQIKAWMQVNAPEILTNLNPPAHAADIVQVEQEIGLSFPEDFKQFLALHDGERDELHAFLADFNRLLSCQEIVSQYQLMQDIGKQLYSPEMETLACWQEQTRDGIIFIKGSVQPLTLHPKWIPFTEMNGDVFRYFDYDPAPGGVMGQVIEVDPEGCSWQVLADSFEDLLDQYALALAQGKYAVDLEVDDCCLVSRAPESVMDWGVPAWLASSS